MSISITGQYIGNKKIKLTHQPSGTSITTSAPIDNQGDGSSFSPSDLVAGALGACMATIMGILAERENIDLSQMNFKVEKHMNQSPRRIGSLPIIFYLPKDLTTEQREKLERAAMTCPVHYSLHPDIQVQVKFTYET